MIDSQEDDSSDVTKPRQVPYKQSGKVYQDAVYWMNLRNAQETTPKLFHEVQKMMEKDHCQPEDFKDRIIFTSMCNDIDWDQRVNEETSICCGMCQEVSQRTVVVPRTRF